MSNKKLGKKIEQVVEERYGTAMSLKNEMVSLEEVRRETAKDIIKILSIENDFPVVQSLLDLIKKRIKAKYRLEVDDTEVC